MPFDKKKVKERTKTIEKKIKEFNKLLPRNIQYNPSDLAIAQAANDEEKYELHLAAKQALTVMTNHDKIAENPTLQKMGLGDLKGIVPNDIINSGEKAIVTFLLAKAMNADHRWLMDNQDNKVLFTGMHDKYDDLLILSNMDTLLKLAEKNQLEVKEEDQYRYTLRSNAVKAKMELVKAETELYSDENYTLLPPLDKYGFNPVVCRVALVDMGDKSPEYTKMLKAYKNVQEVEAKNLEKIKAMNAIFSFKLQEAEDAGAQFFNLNKKVGKGFLRIGFDDIYSAILKGESIGVFYDDENQGFIVATDQKSGNVYNIPDARKAAIVSGKFSEEEYEEYQDKILEIAENTGDKQFDKYVQEHRKALEQDLQYIVPKKKIEGVKFSKGIYELQKQAQASYAQSREIDTIFRNYNVSKKTHAFGGFLQNIISNRPIDPLSPDAENQRSLQDQKNRRLLNLFEFKEGFQPTKGDPLADDNYQENLKPENIKELERQIGLVFKEAEMACDPNWFLNTSDEDFLIEFPERYRKASLLLDMTAYARLAGLKGYDEEYNKKLGFLKKLVNDSFEYASARYNMLKEPYAMDLLAMKLKHKELKEISKNLRVSEPMRASAEAVLRFAEVQRQTGNTEIKPYKFLNRLKDIGVINENIDKDGFINKNLKFYDADKTPITQQEAIERLKVGINVSDEAKRELYNQPIYIVDTVKNTCTKHSLGEEFDQYKQDEVPMDEFKDDLAIRKTESMKNPKQTGEQILDKSILAKTQHLDALYMYKEMIDNTDGVFVKRREQMETLRTNLQKVIDCYENLKPVPLQSDMKKLAFALEDFNKSITAYINYKQAATGVDFTKYDLEAENHEKKLTWREEDRLTAAYGLKKLVNEDLTKSIKEDVIENGIYCQQQRILHGDLIQNDKGRSVAEKLFEKTLSEIRSVKEASKEHFESRAFGYGNIFAEAIHSYNHDVNGEDDKEFDIEESKALSTMAIEAYSDLEDLLVLAYEYEGNMKNPVYPDEVKEKIYDKLAAYLVRDAVINDQAFYPNEDNDSGYDVEGLGEDIKRFRNEGHLKEFFPETKLNFATIVSLVANHEQLVANYDKIYGSKAINVAVRDYQVARGAENDYNGMKVKPHLGKVKEMSVEEFLGENVEEKVEEKVEEPKVEAVKNLQ